MAGKHTPGPWRWDGEPGESDLRHEGVPGTADGCVLRHERYEGLWFSEYGQPGVNEANARLIAAAPDLLAVCEKVAESLCELEVQARNASRADTLGGLDQATIQRMFARLADALAVEQDALRPAIARATQPLPPQSEE